MTISHSGVSGVVILELFKDIAPKTCQNFMSLCDGTVRRKSDSEPICYQDTEIHRIVPGMFIQGGRIAGGAHDNSCYGSEFADESFCVKHTEIGLLGMCKRSGLKHTNES